MTVNTSPISLAETVVSNGFCVGCGICAVPEGSPFKMGMDDFGQFKSGLDDSKIFAKAKIDYEKICPFGSHSSNEDEIASAYYEGDCEYDEKVGYYNGVYAGHVSEGAFREFGSSGGMGTWVLNELLVKDKVDYVIHVKSESAEDHLHNLPFKYSISNTVENVQRGGKSRYYPIELSEVLQKVRNQPGRYALVGLPCFIKSVRLLQAQDPVLAERIRYCVGLVCGHLKSSHYAESLSWQMGIIPEELQAIDFRVKDINQPANRYSTYVKSKAVEKVMPTNNIFGTDWGAGAFKYKACDFCDDVFAETADVVLGDAWLPEYVQDSLGTNVVVTRNPEVRQLIENAMNEGRLAFDQLPVDKAIQSQDAGLRHRKIGIIDRLAFERQLSSWVPVKRTPEQRQDSTQAEKEKQRLRSEMRKISHESFLQAKLQNDINIYYARMRPVYLKYKRLGMTLKGRVKSRIKLLLIAMLKSIGYKRP